MFPIKKNLWFKYLISQLSKKGKKNHFRLSVYVVFNYLWLFIRMSVKFKPVYPVFTQRERERERERDGTLIYFLGCGQKIFNVKYE